MPEFDRFSHDYQAKLEQSIRGLGTVDSALRSKLHILQKLTGSHSNEAVNRILDFGCGTGLLTDLLQNIAQTVFGVDVSLDSLRNSASRVSKLAVFDGFQLPFLDNSFDVVVASCVFHHISPDSRPEIVGEIRRILTLGGILIVIEHNPFNPVTRFVVNRCEFDKDAELLSLSETRTLLRSGQFKKFHSGYFCKIG